MADNIQEIFWMIDAETKKALYVNPAYESITGRPREALQANPRSYEEQIHPEDRAQVLVKLDEATRTGDFDERFRIVLPSEDLRWVWVRGFPVRDGKGRIRRLVGTALDITTQKHAEEEVTRNLALAESAWAEVDAMRKATLALTQDLRMDNVLGHFASVSPQNWSRTSPHRSCCLNRIPGGLWHGKRHALTPRSRR